MNKRIYNKHVKFIGKLLTWRLITASPNKDSIAASFTKWYKEQYNKAPKSKYVKNVWNNYHVIRDWMLYKPKFINRLSYSWIIFMGALAANLGIKITDSSIQSLGHTGVTHL